MFEFEVHLEGLLSCVNKLVTFEFGTLHKRLAALGTDVHAGAVGVEVLPHGRVIPEHLCAALEGQEGEQGSETQLNSTHKLKTTEVVSSPTNKY